MFIIVSRSGNTNSNIVLNPTLHNTLIVALKVVIKFSAYSFMESYPKIINLSKISRRRISYSDS